MKKLLCLFLTLALVLASAAAFSEAQPEAALFTKLTLVCFLVDYTPNTLITLAQAGGKVKRFYLLSSAVAILVFPLTWILYSNGAAAWTAYVFFIGFYILKAAVMLAVVHKDTGLPVRKYVREGVWPAVLPMLIVLPVITGLAGLIAPAWWRFLLMAAVGVALMAASIWKIGLTPGEKAYVKSKIHRK